MEATCTQRIGVGSNCIMLILMLLKWKVLHKLLIKLVHDLDFPFDLASTSAYFWYPFCRFCSGYCTMFTNIHMLCLFCCLPILLAFLALLLYHDNKHSCPIFNVWHVVYYWSEWNSRLTWHNHYMMHLPLTACLLMHLCLLFLILLLHLVLIQYSAESSFVLVCILLFFFEH